MKKLIKNINFEYLYLKYAKTFLAMFLLAIVMNGLLVFMNYEYVSSTYNDYIHMEEWYKESGGDIEGDLSSDYEFVNNEDGSTTVENPIRYYYDQMSQALFVVSPEYAISHILEFSILIFPLLFVILGSVLATSDYKNKVYKHKILRFGRDNYFLSKFIISCCLIFTSVLFVVFVSKTVSLVTYSHICSKFPIEQFEVASVELLSSDLIKLLLMMFISLTYLSIGFCIGTILKSSIVTTCIMAVYLYIIPIFNKFEIKNCCYKLMKDKFNFLGLVNISSGKEIDSLLGIVFILLLIVASNLFSYIIIKKRSAFA